MDLLPMHPKWVHLPMALSVLVPLFAAGLLLAWRRAWLPRRAWWVAVALQACLVLGAAGSMQSGEADEERVERVVPEEHIEAHEEAAERFTWVAGGVLALMLLCAVWPARAEAQAQALALTAIIGAVAVAGLGYQVGRAGGELVYVHGAASALRASPPELTMGTPRRAGSAGAPRAEHHDR